MAIFEKVKTFVSDHPYGTALGVFAVGLLFLLIFRKKPAPVQDSGGFNYAQLADAQAAEVAANNQLAAIQVQAQQNALQVRAQENVASQEIAANVAIETLRSQTAGNANLIAGETAQRIAELQANVANTQSSLQASIANAQTQAQIRAAEIQAAQYTTLNAQNTSTYAQVTANNNQTLENVVAATTQQIGVNGIIHTLPQNSVETALRGAGYTGAFGAGGADAYLIQQYGREGARQWYIEHGVATPGV